MLMYLAANFINFLKRVHVSTTPTEMTFSVSRDHGLFEWAGTSLSSVFCQIRNFFSPRMWRMLFDIVRFNQYALDLLIAHHERRSKSCRNDEETIGDYLDRKGYSAAFRNDYLLPMTASVWSTSPDKCSLQFPARTLIRFLYAPNCRPNAIRY
jgi:predicted NAD/FAD-binding protein